MTKKFLTLAAACLLTFGAIAQNAPGRSCGTTAYNDEQLKNDPTLRLRMEQIEQQTKDYELQNAANKVSAVVTIPVVYHVLYNTNNSTQNVSDARLIENLNVLNLDFAHINADANNAPAVFKALAANTNIQFCMAVRDPNGATTTGIVRKFTNMAVFNYPTNDMKFSANGGDDAWPASSYLNIWVCAINNGILGFAQFPGGTASTDGVVLLNGSVGGPAAPGTSTPYHLGRTATHEVGHWLNLKHIWGDANCGNDLVNDTPTQQTDNGGCPSFPHVTCSNGPNGDMFMNYMDYVNDNCMNMFSAGQSTRMNALFAGGGARVGLVTSQGCVPVGGGCNTPTNLTAQSITQSGATINWSSVAGATIYYIQYRVVGSATWIPVNTTNTSIALSGLSANTAYEYRVSAYCTVYSNYSAIQTFTTLPVSGGCGKPASKQVNNISQNGAAFYWATVSGATKYKLQYRVVGTTAWTTKTSTSASYAVVGTLTAGTTYEYRVRAVCGTVNSAYTSKSTFTTLSASGCTGTDNYEPNNSKAAATPVAINFDAYPLISSASDLDFLSFTTTNGAPKFKVTMDGLPADYDIILYNSAGTQIANSSLAGTTAEQIINNASTGSSYKVKIFGYNGVYNSSLCYHLKITTSATAFREESILNASEKSTVAIFPNPSQGNLTITLESDDNQTSTIDVVDLMGRNVLHLVKDVTEGSNTIALDLNSFADGIYFVKTNTNGDISSNKIVLKK